MKEADRKQIEQRLQAERERALADLRELDADVADDAEMAGELSNYPQHLADEGTANQQAEKDLMLLGKEGERLYDIDEALRRLYRTPELFGHCEECNKEIVLERLELVPWVRYCLEHQAQHEQETRPT
ncbi:MAG: TraR/DksA C4-type zinc finger protein [Gemmatimonadota bacterium]